MDIGVFIPIGNNGWPISTTSPQYLPTFELNKQIVPRIEHYGLDFVARQDDALQAGHGRCHAHGPCQGVIERLLRSVDDDG